MITNKATTTQKKANKQMENGRGLLVAIITTQLQNCLK